MIECDPEVSAGRTVICSSRSSTQRRALARSAGLSRLCRLARGREGVGVETLDRDEPMAAIRGRRLFGNRQTVFNPGRDLLIVLLQMLPIEMMQSAS